MKKNILILLTLFISLVAFAQEGHLSYKFEFESDDENIEMVKSMMGDASMDIYFSKKYSRVKLDMGLMMHMDFVNDIEKKRGLMLVSLAGTKYASYIDEAEINNEEEEKPLRIEITNETKKILSYNCKKALAYDNNGNATEIWYTQDIKNYLANSKQYNFDVDGLPLQVKISQAGMTVILTATSFSEKVDKNVFSMEIPKYYEEVSYEEFLHLGGK